MKEVKKMQIGKNKLTLEFIEQARRLFEKADSIRINVLKSACRDKNELKKIAEDLVNGLGRNFTFKAIGYVIIINKYRRNVRE